MGKDENQLRPAPSAAGEGDDLQLLLWGVAGLLVVGFGGALVGVTLSHRHVGLIHGNPITWTAKHFLPWIATWILMAAMITVGYIAFILPGVYLALRFFWADEFALIHEKGLLRH